MSLFCNNFTLMKVFAKFIIILSTCDICQSYYQPNVGSVLFTSNDLQKNQWTQSELALLRARRYFQNLIPHPKLSNSLSDEYLSHLLNYAENCYITIFNEAANPSEKDLMTNALSDVIGGYLKVWVLPVTKYSYYGGTISPINAIKLFRMYDNIKQSLNTDGGTWKNPNEDLLQTVTINIASNPHEWYTRSTHESCDSLSYYEKTDKGLTIPLPFISWDLYPQTMFIPLKDQSLIQLNSSNSSNALLDYYNVATSCIHSLNTDTIDDFGSRFQIWLSTDVVPHLNDDNLYVAFGSCLSLLNKTKNLYSHMVNIFDNTYSNLQCKAMSTCYPIPLTKKNILIAIIIFIEIVWCIPVLYYLLCTKKSSKKKRDIKNLFTYFRKDPKNFHGVKFFVKPRTRNLELDVEFPTYDHKFYNMKSTSTNISQNNVLYNVAQINESLKKCPSKPNETNNINNKVSHKVNQTDIIETFDTSCNCEAECDNKALCSATNSQIMNNSLKTISSYTGAPSSFMFLNEKEIKNLSYTHATLSVSKSMCKGIITSTDTKVCSKIKSPNTTVRCQCINCSKERSIQVKCLKNIEKTSFKVKNPIVMQVINEHKRDERALYKPRVTEKRNILKTERYRKKAPAVTEVNLNKNKEKISGNLVKLTANENNIKKLSIASNRNTMNEKVTLGKGKTNNTSKIVNNESISFKGPLGGLSPTTKDKIKSLKTIKPSENVEKVSTSIKNDIDKKVSRINTFTIAEMPKAYKNIQNYIPDIDKIAKKNNEDVNKMNPSKREEVQKEITKKSGIPKPNFLDPGTSVPIEPYKKRFNSPSKPCKIPRRIAAHLNDQKEVSLGCKSVKTTVDDTVVKKPINKNTKLNTTL